MSTHRLDTLHLSSHRKLFTKNGYNICTRLQSSGQRARFAVTNQKNSVLRIFKIILDIILDAIGFDHPSRRDDDTKYLSKNKIYRINDYLNNNKTEKTKN